MSGVNESYNYCKNYPVVVAANENAPPRMTSATATTATGAVLPGPLANDFNCFSPALSFQQNGNFPQKFGPPPNMTNQNGSFGWRRSWARFGVDPQPAQRPTRGGVTGRGRFHQPRQRQPMKASGAMYGRKPTPTMMVASNHGRNYTERGRFQPQYASQAVLGTDGNATGMFTGRNCAGPGPLNNMRSLEQYFSDMMRTDSTNGDQLDGRTGMAKWNYANGADNHVTGVGVVVNEVGGTMGPTGVGMGVGVGMSNSGERLSRKVFVGGLPPDIDEDEIAASFRRFGPHVIDWPFKAERKSYFPPKGFVFLLFLKEASVYELIDACFQDGDKLYLCVSSPSITDKLVQIRPWRLSDAGFALDASVPLDPRKTVFVGGVPRPMKAIELAKIMDSLYGGVCYAGIETDSELKYPKGAGRVAFSNQLSYIAAISARYVKFQHGDAIDKRVEIKPYVLDDQLCDECEGARCGGTFAPFFCGNVTCLQYYCENCWTTIHSRLGREYHKPLTKEVTDYADRSRPIIPFRHAQLNGYRRAKKNPF